ncbi:hypothetical protein BGZ65_002341 [Modicella reniformis]|uniref:ornithine decarboxylase n=1 Tax=Modicella reniformis TaxID=1440133 RepID=A0A9P6J1D2_9FUNG|nr:hypothetical protein BGZ65_002341 [Modicella reniformis]
MIDISHQQEQFEVVPTLVPPTLVEVLKSRVKASLIREAQLPQIHTLPIEYMLQARLASFDAQSDDAEVDNAFYVADLGEVYRQHLRWKFLLPRIEPFFAMKCNPDPMVMRLLASLGAGFDCASKNEIQSVLEMGVEPSRIIYANPCKQNSFVKFAYNNKVRMMTFDNAEELYKIKRFHPDAQLVLRILTDDSKSLCKLGLKFGAPLDTTGFLLATAQDLGLNVIGVSFHVGSGCFDANAFGEAVIRARRVFDQARNYGYEFNFLDVGGGFPSAHVTEGITFEKVIARRTIHRDRTEVLSQEQTLSPSHMYYINDGMYGSFNCIMFDHQICEPKVLLKDGAFTYQQSLLEIPHGYASVWGPTCDSIDCISAKSCLPLMESGDWLYFDNMGAYTITAASQFNGFRKSEILYTTTEPEVSLHF